MKKVDKTIRWDTPWFYGSIPSKNSYSAWHWLKEHYDWPDDDNWLFQSNDFILATFKFRDERVLMLFLIMWS
jgi:hypothetical protein